MSAPMDDDPITEPGGDDPTQAGATAVAAPPAPVVSLTPEQVRSSPEYQALLAQNRTLARQSGDARAAAEAARIAAEETRLAAEATQQAVTEQQVREILGEDGVTAWNAISEQAQTDPVGAARRFRELMTTAGAQSAAAIEPPAAPPAAPPAGEGTPPVDTPPAGAPPRGVDADAPLTPVPGQELVELQNSLTKRFDDTATAVQQQPGGGRKVSMKERAGALIGYLAGDYLRQGARPADGGRVTRE